MYLFRACHSPTAHGAMMQHNPDTAAVPPTLSCHPCSYSSWYERGRVQCLVPELIVQSLVRLMIDQTLGCLHGQ